MVVDETEEMTSRVMIRVGDVVIDITGSQSDLSDRVTRLGDDSIWTEALVQIREARDAAIEAARSAARTKGLPERGSAFASLLDNCNLTRKPDRVLAAIHYLREVDSIRDSPPRVIRRLFTDAGFKEDDLDKWNISLYLNRLREQGRLAIPDGMPEKNRFVILTPEGRAHLDGRALD